MCITGNRLKATNCYWIAYQTFQAEKTLASEQFKNTNSYKLKTDFFKLLSETEF